MVRRKTDEQFKKEVFDSVGDEYTFLDTYVNAMTKIQVKHNKCGHIYEVSPSNFLRGKRCPHCVKKSQRAKLTKTDAEFKKEVFDLVGDEYIFLEPYQGAHTKLKVKHNKCGHTYKVTPANFLMGRRCSYCAGLIKKTNEQFKNEVHNIVGDEYVFLDYYVNAITKIRVKHNKCGHIYMVTPNDFLNCHNRCPYCNSPKGETLISKILDTLNIRYESQKTFSDLKDDRLLSYDFFIPDQNILIEYQGIQHYESIDYFGGKDRFKYQKKHDKLKSDYAKFHSYNLITVPYTEDTLSKINKYLIKHGLVG